MAAPTNSQLRQVLLEFVVLTATELVVKEVAHRLRSRYASPSSGSSGRRRWQRAVGFILTEAAEVLLLEMRWEGPRIAAALGQVAQQRGLAGRPAAPDVPIPRPRAA